MRNNIVHFTATFLFVWDDQRLINVQHKALIYLERCYLWNIVSIGSS